jgi:hypothetical protein
MNGAIYPLPQYVFMAWCLVKPQGQLYLITNSILPNLHMKHYTATYLSVFLHSSAYGRLITFSRISSVSVVTGLQAGRFGFDSRYGQGFLLSSLRSDRLWVHPASYTMGTGRLSLRVK